MKEYKSSAFEKNSFFALLPEAPGAPKQLFVRGELPTVLESTKILTVVGSRKYTSYGKDVCEKLIQSLSGTDTIIVSGLALGIDAIAHKAALDAGLRTVAVLGNGLSDSVLYPKQHLGLAHEIINKGGALISEYPPDFEAKQYSFPARNRILVGLAHAVLVIEAGEKSGTLITARLGTEYNRDVLAVPGDIRSEGSKGPHMLIRLGATPITSTRDLREALNLTENTHESLNNQKELFGHLSLQEKRLLDILYEPKSKDVFLAEAKLSTSEGLVELTSLELKGLIKEELGVIRRC
jgi:DNA processing protein